MITIDVKNIVSMRDRLKPETTFIGILADTIDRLPAVQNRWFSNGGASGFKTLATGTVVSRLRRWGYYRAAPATGVSALYPYGKWTGKTIAHTTGVLGRVSIRSLVATVQTSIERWWVVTWWDEKEIERQLGLVAEARFRNAFDGGRVAA